MIIFIIIILDIDFFVWIILYFKDQILNISKNLYGEDKKKQDDET